MFATPCVSATAILSSIINHGVLRLIASYDWEDQLSGIGGIVILGHDGDQPITVSAHSLPSENLVISQNVTFKYSGTDNPSLITCTNNGFVQLTGTHDATDHLQGFSVGSGSVEVGDGALENIISVNTVPSTVTINSNLTYSGTDTINTIITGTGTFKHVSNTSIDGISVPDGALEIGDGSAQTIAAATNAIQKTNFKINENARLNMFMNPTESQTLQLGGRGVFHLSGGGTIHGMGSSPDLDIENGTFNINNDYGAGGAVNVSIKRDGVVNVIANASLNAQSLTYYLGDGNAALSSVDPLKTGTLNFQEGANNSTLPIIITVDKDATLSDRDIIEKLHTLAPGAIISTLITGGDKVNNGTYAPNVSENITSNLFNFGLQNTGTNLNLIVKSNNTPEFLGVLAPTEFDAADTLVKGSVSGVTLDEKPDPGAFHAKSSRLLNQVKLLAVSIKNSSIPLMNMTSRTKDVGMSCVLDAEPLVIPLKNSHSAVFLAPIYGQSQTRSTAFVTGSSAHQLGLLGGFETSNNEAQQFISIQGAVLVGHSIVRKGSRSSTFSKTGLLGVFFSQGFLQEAEWNTFTSASFTYGHANRFTSSEMYQSRPKSRRFTISSELAYKFKYYDNDNDKSMLSFRPLAGLKYAHIESSAHTEQRKVIQGVGLTTLGDQYHIVDVFTSLGARRRFLLNDNVSFKVTGIVEYHRNLHRPSSMVKKIMFARASTPIAFQINNYAKNKYLCSLTGSISQKDNNWKAFLKASVIKDRISLTYQLMLTLNRKF
jgi:hypothetical protein